MVAELGASLVQHHSERGYPQRGPPVEKRSKDIRVPLSDSDGSTPSVSDKGFGEKPDKKGQSPSPLVGALRGRRPTKRIQEESSGTKQEPGQQGFEEEGT